MASQRGSIVMAAAAVPAGVKAQWKSAFNEFDVAKNGVISEGELESIMSTRLKMNPAPGEVQAMITAVDHNEDNVISYDEFELMMVAAGRGVNGAKIGFSHVVNRFIRMKEVATLIAQECRNFVSNFSEKHREHFLDLPTADANAVEQNPMWFDTFKQFCEEAELTMQNVLMLWGAGSMKSFDDEFLDAVSETGVLDDFLRYTNYGEFIKKMYAAKQAGPDPGAGVSRPETPCSQPSTHKRLAQLDRELSMLDFRRNEILAERRRLIGCEVEPVTANALKHELQMRQWREEVGFD